MLEKCFDSSPGGLLRVRSLREGVHGALLDSSPSHCSIRATPISQRGDTFGRQSTSLTGRTRTASLCRSGTTACSSASVAIFGNGAVRMATVGPRTS
jgi:hypothetical protein